MGKLTCGEAKQIDLVNYLASLGHHPQRIKGSDHWYLSPLRDEKTASFKVNRTLNLWYDHGIGKGGDIVDFGTLYYGCSVSDWLQRLPENPFSGLSFHPHVAAQQEAAGEKKDSTQNKIIILEHRPLADVLLVNYLNQRCIPMAVAESYCREVDFSLYDKNHRAIGFPNDAGGFELRNENFKGSSAPKGITFIEKGAGDLSVFEGFFNFLSFFTGTMPQARLTNFLVLNSLSFLEKSHDLMEKYGRVYLYLDRDGSGLQATKNVLEWNKDRYKDCSRIYERYKDYNEWLVKEQEKQKLRQGRHKGFRL